MLLWKYRVPRPGAAGPGGHIRSGTAVSVSGYPIRRRPGRAGARYIELEEVGTGCNIA